MLSFSEEDTATIKNCLYFFEISLRNFNKHDEEFIDLIIQLVLFILSKQSFSQDTINEVGSKLVALLKIIIHKLLYTATFGENNQFQAEIQVCTGGVEHYHCVLSIIKLYLGCFGCVINLIYSTPSGIIKHMLKIQSVHIPNMR